jgi:hypothetical protein
MAVDWKNILLGGLGVVALFKGADILTHPNKNKGFKAEDWSGDSNDIPMAVDYFCAIKILEGNGYRGKKTQNEIKAQMMKKVFPFLKFERKYGGQLNNLIGDRLNYYENEYGLLGRTAIQNDKYDLKNKLMVVSSEELGQYFTNQAFKATLRGLPDLPKGTTENGVRVRFAPNPNGPLSMGHSFGIIINDTYAKAYNGEYILRLDDTDPDQKRPVRKLYSQIVEEFEFLTDRGEGEYELHIASERKNRYIDLTRRLITEGKAYVSCIPHKTFADKYQHHLTATEIEKGKSPMQSAQGIPSPDRNKSVETNLKQFDEMVKLGYYHKEDGSSCIPENHHITEDAKYKEVGTIVPTVWLKTPMNSYRKYRDMKIMRATHRKHPHDEEGKVWPYLNFQGAVDDYELKITHMIRGCDLWETEIAYPIIWDALGWDTSQLPTFLYWPRLFFEDFAIPYTDVETGLPEKLRAIGTSKMARLIANQPEFNGNWCHFAFPTVCSYMARGYPASYLTDFWLGDVWGQTFPYFNGEKLKIGDNIYEPLTYEMGQGKIEMRGFNKKLGNYKSQQARVPYPLTSDGLMRHTPAADIITPTLLPITA